MSIARTLCTKSAPKRTVVELFYDIVSPYSYIQFELLARQQDRWPSMSLRYTPTAIRGVFVGADNSPPMRVPAKGAYLFRDLLRVSDYHKIPFHLPEDFAEFALNTGTLNTQRFLEALRDGKEDDPNAARSIEPLIRLFFRKFFAKPRADLSDFATIRSIAIEAGLSEQTVGAAISAAQTDPIKQRLKQNTDRALEFGAFGLPHTVIHGAEPAGIWGSDRMHIIGHLLGEPEPPLLR